MLDRNIENYLSKCKQMINIKQNYIWNHLTMCKQ